MFLRLISSKQNRLRRLLRTPTGISPNKGKHSLIANSYHGTMLPTKMVHHRDKTSRAMANRCWCLITSFCCRIFCLLIYLLLLFVYFSLVCCCYCCCYSCFRRGVASFTQIRTCVREKLVRFF